MDPHPTSSHIDVCTSSTTHQPTQSYPPIAWNKPTTFSIPIQVIPPYHQWIYPKIQSSPPHTDSPPSSKIAPISSNLSQNRTSSRNPHTSPSNESPIKYMDFRCISIKSHLIVSIVLLLNILLDRLFRWLDVGRLLNVGLRCSFEKTKFN